LQNNTKINIKKSFFLGILKFLEFVNEPLVHMKAAKLRVAARQYLMFVSKFMIICRI